MRAQSYLISSFYDTVRTHGRVADLTLNWDKSALLEDLIPPKRYPFFTTLGKHGSGSVIAIWDLGNNDGLEDRPVVWIDSEGDPYSVFASNFKEFLSLLPYGTGLLYDFISAWWRYLQAPEKYQHLLGKYNTKDYDAALASASASYVGHEELMVWLARQGLVIAADPFLVVGLAIQSLPALDKWLDHER